MKPGGTPHEEGMQPPRPGSDASPADAVWSIGELAAQLGVTTRTIRFYEAQQLIAPEREKGARVYGRRDRARMQLILRGKNLGFTLDVIRQYLSLYDADPDQVTQTQMFLEKVEASIDDLERKKVDIERTLSELKVLQLRAAAFLKDRT
jgi:DNA-binding transcriptional MerR regulator